MPPASTPCSFLFKPSKRTRPHHCFDAPTTMCHLRIFLKPLSRILRVTGSEYRHRHCEASTPPGRTIELTIPLRGLPMVPEPFDTRCLCRGDWKLERRAVEVRKFQHSCCSRSKITPRSMYGSTWRMLGAAGSLGEESRRRRMGPLCVGRQVCMNNTSG